MVYPLSNFLVNFSSIPFSCLPPRQFASSGGGVRRCLYPLQNTAAWIHQCTSSLIPIRCISFKYQPTKTKDVTNQDCLPSALKFSLVDGATKNIQKTVAAFLIFVNVSCPFPSIVNENLGFLSAARAVLYSPDTKVPRSGELALRKAIPANTSMKSIQNSLEGISFLLRIPQRKPYGTMEADAKRALKIAMEEKDKILASIQTDLKEKGMMLHSSLVNGKGGLQDLIEYIKENDPDKVSVGLSSSLDIVAELELLQAPGLSFFLPEQYLGYPRLTGRATVEFIIEKGEGLTFSLVGGEPRKTTSIQVLDGAYDGVKLTCTNQAIISDNKSVGYSVPLEIMPSGQFEPLYRTMLDVQAGELPVLPLSVYGAVAMAHNEGLEEYSSPFQFFLYLYDKRSAGLGGLSFEEGQFSVFGYTTVGREILPQINSGDIIRSAKLVQGQERLILPAES